MSFGPVGPQLEADLSDTYHTKVDGIPRRTTYAQQSKDLVLEDVDLRLQHLLVQSTPEDLQAPSRMSEYLSLPFYSYLAS